MTTTLAAGVRDITPLSVVGHDQQKTTLQQRYDDYDTVGIPHHLQQQQQQQQQHKAPSSSSAFESDRRKNHHRFRKKQQHHINNNGINSINASSGKNRKNLNSDDHSGQQNTKQFQPRPSNSNGGAVNYGWPRRRKTGPIDSINAPPTPNDNLTSDYDNVIPSPSAAADAAARLSKVEEEEAAADDGEQKEPFEKDKETYGLGMTSSSSSNDTIIAADDSDKNVVEIADPQHPRDVWPSPTTNGIVTPNYANGDEAEPLKINDTDSQKAADGVSCSHARSTATSVSVSDQQSTRTRTDDGSGDGVSRELYENSTKERRWKWESEGGGSSGGGGVCSDLDNNNDDEDAVEQRPAASLGSSVSAIPLNFVGKNERLLKEERSDVCDSNIKFNGIVGKNHSAVDRSGLRGDDCLCDSRTFTSEQNIGTDLENVSVNREEYDQRSSDCDNADSSGKFAGAVVVESCGEYGVHSKDYDNVSSNVVSVPTVNKSWGTDCKNTESARNEGEITCTGCGELQRKEPPLHYSVPIKSLKMGAKQSKRPHANKAVSYDHGQSKIEMKDLSKNGVVNVNQTDNCRNNNFNHKHKVHGNEKRSVDPIHGETVEDENRSLSLDSYQTIPEYPERCSKGSASASSVSFDDRDDRLSSTLTLTPNSISSCEDLRIPNGSNEVEPQPIYAVVNKNKRRLNDAARQPVVENPINEMDGDYSVPSWGQNETSQPRPSCNTVLQKQRQHVVNPSRKHRETVSACVSASSLASSERGGEKAKPTAFSHDDDEYDDAFVDPNNRPQMKKSSTTDSIVPEHWKRSLKFPRSQSSSRDYFSLGRRPKVKRSRTLVDAHGKAVSMDTLLKARRRGSSFREPSDTTTADNLSVEDILKSCEDFDADSLGFRSRSESANSVSSHNTPLSFFLLKENGVPEVASSRGHTQFNNLNASVTDSNESANSSLDIVHNHNMNIVNGEDVELRPSRSQVGGQTIVSSSKFQRIPGTSNVQSVSSSQDLKTKQKIMSSANTPSSVSSSSSILQTRPLQSKDRTTNNHTTSVPTSSSSSALTNPSCQASMTISQPQNRSVMSSSDTFQNYSAASATFLSNPQSKRNISHSTTSSSGVFTLSTLTETSSVSLVSSPEITFDSDQDANSSVTSPFPVFSPNSPDAPPSKLTSLTVDVSSPLSESSTSQSSSPAPRSPNSLAKLEAVEAIKWLRAAGFPQYAQMFDDGLFPIELALVEKDHDFLDKDSIQSLFRRLETLNKYAGMKIDAHQRKKAASEEEEEDDICALSERWEYQKSVRRWSRKDLALSTRPVSSSETTDLITRGSHDSLLADQDSGSQTGDSPTLNTKMPHKDGRIGEECGGDEYDGGTVVTQDHTDGKQNIGSPGDQQNVGVFPISPRLRRAASERIKTAKILWKKMEGGLKSKKSRRHPRNIMEISDPVVAVADQENMQAKLQRLNCVDISPTLEQVPPPSMNSTKESLSPSDRLSPPASTQIPLSPPKLDTSTEDESLPLRFRSRSAVESRSVREKPSLLYVKENPDKTSSDTLNSHDTQRSATSSGTDSSLKEYYTAQSQLLKTLESAHPSSRSNSFRKNSNDTGLMEIFLLPQDHQPGKFPRLLQNGYIETESRGVPANSRFVRENPSSNASDRIGADESAGGCRVSVYDNFSTSNDGSKRTTDKCSRSLSEIHEDDSKQVDLGNDALHISENRDNSNVVKASSQQSSYHELRDKILKEASSPSLPLSEIQSEQQERGSSPASTKGVSHSISVDSYLNDNNGSGSHRRNSSGGSNTADTTHCDVNASHERSLSQQYDEFDLILREMYANISDLTRRMTENTEESILTSTTTTATKSPQNPLSTSSSTSSSSSYSSSSSSHKKPTRPTLALPDKTHQHQHNLHHHIRHHHHHHHQTDASTYDPEGVPVSPNSDPILSPTSPLSHRLGDDSVDTDGATDPDNENSSSGGGDDSHTGESVSDPEGGLDLSHDDSLEQIPAMTRERRDSGVGHSLTRAPSDRRRKKLRWHSFQRCHRPDINSRSMQINSLTVGQLVWLQKLSLLKLTGIMEKCLPVNKSGWNWMMPRFMKRNKTPDFSDKNVFGVPLSVMAQRTGQPLPQCVLYAMRYLRRTSQHAVGIFRKSGVKSKIQSLIDHLEANPDTTDFEDMNAYNVADMIKTFFRDLPECLLTNKLSETFRSIYTHVPKPQLLEAIQAAVLLLPDENREVLQSLLLFLSDISMHEADHQMNATNLAVCFTPTVFMLGFKQTPLSHSPKRSRKAAASAPGVPDPREILEQKTSQDCLLLMITECKKLFTVPPKLFRQVQVQSVANKEVSPVFELSGEEGTISEEIRAFGQERVQKVLKEAHDKNRGWLPVMTISNIEVSHRKPLDDCPLKEWKLVVDVDAPPIEVLSRIMHERHAWDEDLLSWSVVERIDPHSDIFQYVLNSMAPHPPRHFCVLRYWRTDLSKGACALITMSVDHADVQEIHGVAAVDYGSLYLMEPCGSGKTRLTHVTRMDTRGRCPEWYSKVFGHIVESFMERLRDSFKQETSGPETKV